MSITFFFATTVDMSSMARKLSWLLRHNLEEISETVPEDGYVPLDAVLTFLRSGGFRKASATDVEKIVMFYCFFESGDALILYHPYEFC
jgi:RNA:NAD 2'-phosphotransferase (TPT1/KptA family)